MKELEKLIDDYKKDCRVLFEEYQRKDRELFDKYFKRKEEDEMVYINHLGKYIRRWDITEDMIDREQELWKNFNF